ncbi:hypothetical protein MST16_09135 [Acinetobacter sp. YH16040_T]|uniref:hypothetical protein n=1 Tax=unclassified Acinetobacter TaxID=196816 RepID=UPI0015D3C678|nr:MULTISPECIES: hypothetical protein [unclassified Acinetobacter]MBI1450360.1 hypothetical protein [Acinetobacter sp. FL51]UUS56292.1 hypothetical protein MST16_09135 [Acinetobacter sp. YH16040_T]
MKNKISDVHNILIEQLDRLNDLTDKDGNPISPDLVQREFNRAKAINATAQSIVALNTLVLEAQKLKTPEQRALLPTQFDAIEG